MTGTVGTMGFATAKTRPAQTIRVADDRKHFAGERSGPQVFQSQIAARAKNKREPHNARGRNGAQSIAQWSGLSDPPGPRSLHALRSLASCLRPHCHKPHVGA
eukprot:1870859-Amphidinium_carterae.1